MSETSVPISYARDIFSIHLALDNIPNKTVERAFGRKSNADSMAQDMWEGPDDDYKWPTSAEFRELVSESEDDSAKASTFTVTGAISDGETVTLDGKTFTFQVAPTDFDGNVLIGAGPEETLNNLADAINLVAASAGVVFAASTTPILFNVEARRPGSGVLEIFAISPVFPTTATTANGSWTGAESTIQSGALSVRVEGLGDGYKELSEVVLMDGTTPVATTEEYLRINRTIAESTGTFPRGGNKGKISLRSTGGDDVLSVILAESGVEAGVDFNTMYTVAADKTLLIEQLTVNVDSNQRAAVYLYAYRPASGSLTAAPFGAAIVTAVFDGIAGVAPQPFRSALIKVDEKTDIWGRSMAKAANTAVALGYTAILVDTPGL